MEKNENEVKNMPKKKGKVNVKLIILVAILIAIVAGMVTLAVTSNANTINCKKMSSNEALKSEVFAKIKFSKEKYKITTTTKFYYKEMNDKRFLELIKKLDKDGKNKSNYNINGVTKIDHAAVFNSPVEISRDGNTVTMVYGREHKIQDKKYIEQLKKNIKEGYEKNDFKCK